MITILYKYFTNGTQAGKPGKGIIIVAVAPAADFITICLQDKSWFS